jgi:hypothetical protein
MAADRNYFFHEEIYHNGKKCPVCSLIFYDVKSMKEHVIMVHVPVGKRVKILPGLISNKGCHLKKSGVQFSKKSTLKKQGDCKVKGHEHDFSRSIENRGEMKFENTKMTMDNRKRVAKRKIENRLDSKNKKKVAKFGEKINECEYCERSYTYKTDLLIHKKLIHLNFRYQCSKCKETLTNSYRAKQHAKKHKWAYPKTQMRLINMKEYIIPLNML